LAIGSKDCKLWSVIDEWVQRIGRYLLHQSDRELPRTYFPNGVSAGTKLAGHKRIGVLLVLHIMLKMKAPRDAIINSTQMTRPILDQWCKVFGLQLAWRAWLKRDTISMAEVTVSTLGHKRLMGYLKRYAPRTLKMGWRIIKFHMILHMTRYIIDFGVPVNIDTLTVEHNHIKNSKNPSTGTQQRAYSIERQTNLFPFPAWCTCCICSCRICP
jgi:hypothetical protein